MKYIKAIINATLLAVLVFFSISFLTVLKYINPVIRHKWSYDYSMEIGFPFSYYGQFWMKEGLHNGWHPSGLLFDIILTWLVVVVLYFGWTQFFVTKKHNS